jgi:predicted dienelactone hydrolase
LSSHRRRIVALPFGVPSYLIIGSAALSRCPHAAASRAWRFPQEEGESVRCHAWVITPAVGDGPFPVVVMAHGFGSQKVRVQGWVAFRNAPPHDVNSIAKF